MSFSCKECGETVSNSKMAGLVFGQITKATLERKGIHTESELSQGFNSQEFSGGFLTALGIKCPKCKKSNWD